MSAAGDAKRPLVLVAEDDPAVRMLVTRSVGTVAEVESVENGQEAWERLQQQPVPQLVITDLMMPKMDGLELLRKMKRQDHLAKVPVIVLSAKDTPRDHVSAIKSGARAYVVKPFQPLQLIDRVKATLGL